MRAKSIVICGITLAVLLLTLVAGMWAGSRYQDRIPARGGLSSSALAPLPGWAGEPLPDFASYSDATERKQEFFDYLFPRIALANQRVLALRSQVQTLATKDTLTPADEVFLAGQAERLRVEAPMGSPEQFELLLRRLDMVPPSLAMAQAANESAWGTSRFAREGNNLFGQWCFSEGCGLVPQSRGADASHEVAAFDSPYQSVRSYLTNLNRHPSYQALRDDRARLRADNRLPTGTLLATGLEAYSERGKEYIDEILSMMRFNKLQQYDKLFAEWLQAQSAADEPYVLLRDYQAATIAE